MAVDERRRKLLHDALERTIGPDEAATMMELVPHGGWDEVATKRDVEATTRAIEALEHRMDAKLGGLEGRMDAKLEGLETKMEAMESRVEAKIERLKGETQGLARSVVMWTSSMVVAMAGLSFAAGKFI